MSEKIHKAIITILLISFCALILLFIPAIARFEDRSEKCAVKGGVMLRTTGGWCCFDVKEMK